MDIGKIPESVLKRAVLKNISANRKEILVGAGIGEDCAVFALEPDEVFIVSSDPITGTAQDIGKLGIHVTLNDLAASGAQPVGVMLTILLPKDAKEEELSFIMAQAQAECDKQGIQIAGGHTEVTAAVTKAIIIVTGIGKARRGGHIATKGAAVGMQIVISKWAGLEGSSIIAKLKQQELETRLHPMTVNAAKEFDQYLSVLPESRIALTHNVASMHDVTEGGVFGALWEMAKSANIGLNVDLKKIPIRQETVEICNFYDINPYELISSGCMLMASYDGYKLANALNAAGINAAVIGEFTEGSDRIIEYDGKKRYLTPPKADELYKVCGGN